MPNKCPQCGATLPPGALEGLCPACLLRQGAETGPPPDSLPIQPPRVEEVARLFPQLEILAFIGKGGMGAVYKARQPVLDRIVALKILPPEAAGGPGICRAIQSRSPRVGPFEPSQHRRRLRIRPGQRAAVLYHGICGRPEPAAVGTGRKTSPRARPCKSFRKFAKPSNSPTTKASSIATSSRKTSCWTKRAA